MQKWKLLRSFSKWPAGTELVRRDGEWFVAVAGAQQPVSSSLGKMLDGLTVNPKNWIERLGAS